MARRELRPGVLRTDLLRVAAGVQARTPGLVGGLAEKVADRARELVSEKQHAYGTPSPASPGGPPAMISGTLHDAIGASAPRPTGTGSWQARAGIITGRVPWYGHTEAAKYGYYLDKEGLRNGTRFPFLTTAFKEIARSGAAAAVRRGSGFISAA